MRDLSFFLRLHAFPSLARFSMTPRKPYLPLEVRYFLRPSENFDNPTGPACGYLAPLYHQEGSLFINTPEAETEMATPSHNSFLPRLLSIVLAGLVLKEMWLFFELDGATQLKALLILAVLSVWALLAVVIYTGIKSLFED